MTNDVSRETEVTPSLPPTPSVVRRVFASERLPLIEAYGELLASDGVVRGLIGPREVPRLWDRHLLNCAVLGRTLPAGASVCDIGSGAGLPGLVLAIARPDLEITLVEPLLRRTNFLVEVVQALGLEHVRVHRGRADSLHGTERFDVVTSRAVAPLERLLDWSMPLVAPTGSLIAMKGASVHDEIASASRVLARLGADDPEVLSLGGDVLEETTCAVRVSWADPSRVGLPLASPGASSSAPTSRSTSHGKRPLRSNRKGPR
ncbi:16S rRNA (guanine(527)-N(7))-methyltransferase RsmG [Nocardioides sp. InS609-2]|uniref:16S rRNA (guanine(527)-N(7))-methyltransferase RsmG n=1 Tax=Nocardioides sp. InS609-2 TaxID=2760705 RepID=UPI0020BD568F|nr:16S rRNA (guanine(527)-N(7))-methyltransferase RsmG [Nocardioides sp. InS609-2]